MIFIFFLASLYSNAFAVTDKGKIVILNSDGTWQYKEANKSNSNSILEQIPTNKELFTKPRESSFLLKSNINSSAYWINTDKWIFKKSPESADTEYTMRLRGSDLYAVTITERVEIKLEELAKIAIENVKEKASDVEIVQKEYRVVNGKKVIFMQIKATLKSIKFTYYGYYYSDKSGSTQLVVFTATNLVDKYKTEIFKLLNGFTEQ